MGGRRVDRILTTCPPHKQMSLAEIREAGEQQELNPVHYAGRS